MSQTANESAWSSRSTPTTDELSALKKLEAAERLANQCCELDQVDSDADQPLAWRETLELWLKWNKAHQQVTSKLFQDANRNQNVEDMMDQLDRMRRQAVAMSEQLIG
jgi:hypothetical protein